MEVRYESSAERDLARLRTADARVIVHTFAAYATGELGDIKLRDFKVPTWRLRAGRYRVLYQRMRYLSWTAESLAQIIELIDLRPAFFASVAKVNCSIVRAKASGDLRLSDTYMGNSSFSTHLRHCTRKRTLQNDNTHLNIP